MNDLIQLLYEKGLTSTVYDIFFALGFVSVFLFIVLFSKKVNVPYWKAIVLVLIVYPAVVVWMFIMYWIESGFTHFGGNNIVRVFVYVPLVAYPVAKLLKIENRKINSMLALGPAAVHAVSHIGCVFAGCCNGYPSSWGVYNVITKSILFPNQLLEVILAWAILIYLLVRAKKKQYIPDGREYPIMLMMFGGTRFLCEFLRDNEKLLLGCSSLAFHALFMAVVGAIWLIVLNKSEKHSKKQEEYGVLP